MGDLGGKTPTHVFKSPLAPSPLERAGVRSGFRGLFILLLLSSFGLLHAQSALLGAGADATGAGGSASTSLGEMAYTTIDAAMDAAQGVQQGYERNGGVIVWNGSSSMAYATFTNWTPAIVPVYTVDISIPGSLARYPIVSTASEVINNMTIDAGATITLATNSFLTVNTAIANNADVWGITIKSAADVATGSLVFHNAQGNPVSAAVEFYSKASKPATEYKWQYFGIPLRAIVANGVFNNSWVYLQHENDSPSHWEPLTIYSTLRAFKGYCITQPNAKTFTLYGTLHNNDTTMTLPKSASTYPGDHLIGNPYTAAINIKETTADDGTGLYFGSTMDKTVYLFNTGSKQDWTDAGSGTAVDPAASVAGQFTAIPQNNAGAGGLPATIPSMQGFSVKVTTADGTNNTLKIPYSAVLKNIDAVGERQRAPAAQAIYTIVSVRGKSLFDRIWLFTEASCTHTFDNGWDGAKVLSSGIVPQLYAHEPDNNYQVNTVDDVNNTDLGFRAGADTLYTMHFTHQNLDRQYSQLFLFDKVENSYTDITTTGTEYSFAATNTAAATDRFRIVTSPGTVTDVAQGTQQCHVFSAGKTVFVKNNFAQGGKVTLYDMMGRALLNQTFAAQAVSSFKVNLPAGVYAVRSQVAGTKTTKNLIIN